MATTEAVVRSWKPPLHCCKQPTASCHPVCLLVNLICTASILDFLHCSTVSIGLAGRMFLLGTLMPKGTCLNHPTCCHASVHCCKCLRAGTCLEGAGGPKSQQAPSESTCSRGQGAGWRWGRGGDNGGEQHQMQGGGFAVSWAGLVVTAAASSCTLSLVVLWARGCCRLSAIWRTNMHPRCWQAHTVQRPLDNEQYSMSTCNASW